LELLEIRGDPAPRFRASEIVNFLLIDINLEGLLDVFVAYLAYRLVYSIFPE
jgi:hypothetical protein